MPSPIGITVVITPNVVIPFIVDLDLGILTTVVPIGDGIMIP